MSGSVLVALWGIARKHLCKALNTTGGRLWLLTSCWRRPTSAFVEIFPETVGKWLEIRSLIVPGLELSELSHFNLADDKVIIHSTTHSRYISFMTFFFLVLGFDCRRTLWSLIARCKHGYQAQLNQLMTRRCSDHGSSQLRREHRLCLSK